MQRQEPNEIQENRVSGVLEPGPVFVHNRHLQSGVRTSGRCGVCATGLDSILTPVANVAAPAKDEVAESDGGDEKGDATPPPDSWERR